MASTSTDGITDFMLNNLIGVFLVLHVFMFIFWFIWEPGFWIIFWFLTVYCIFMFFYEAPYKALDLYKNPNGTLVKPITLFNTVALLLFFYVIVFIFGIPMNEGSKDIWITLLEAGLWTFLTFVIFVDFFYYIMNVNVMSIDDKKATNYIVNLINGYTPTSVPTKTGTGTSTSGGAMTPPVGSSGSPSLIPVPNGSNSRIQLFTTPQNSYGAVDLYVKLLTSSNSQPFLLMFRNGVERNSRDNLSVGGMYNDIVAVDLVPTKDSITDKAVELILMTSSGKMMQVSCLIQQQTLSSGTWPAGTVYKVEDKASWNTAWNNYIMVNPQLLFPMIQGAQQSSNGVKAPPVQGEENWASSFLKMLKQTASQLTTSVPTFSTVQQMMNPTTVPGYSNLPSGTTLPGNTNLPSGTTLPGKQKQWDGSFCGGTTITYFWSTNDVNEPPPPLPPGGITPPGGLKPFPKDANGTYIYHLGTTNPCPTNASTTTPSEFKIIPNSIPVSVPPGEKTIFFGRCFGNNITYVFKTNDLSILPPSPPAGSSPINSPTGWVKFDLGADGIQVYHLGSTNPCPTNAPTQPQTNSRGGMFGDIKPVQNTGTVIPSLTSATDYDFMDLDKCMSRCNLDMSCVGITMTDASNVSSLCTLLSSFGDSINENVGYYTYAKPGNTIPNPGRINKTAPTHYDIPQPKNVPNGYVQVSNKYYQPGGLVPQGGPLTAVECAAKCNGNDSCGLFVMDSNQNCYTGNIAYYNSRSEVSDITKNTFIKKSAYLPLKNPVSDKEYERMNRNSTLPIAVGTPSQYWDEKGSSLYEKIMAWAIMWPNDIRFLAFRDNPPENTNNYTIQNVDYNGTIAGINYTDSLYFAKAHYENGKQKGHPVVGFTRYGNENERAKTIYWKTLGQPQSSTTAHTYFFTETFQNMSEGFTTSAPPQNFNNTMVPGRSLVEITTPLPPSSKPSEPTSQPYLWSDFTAFISNSFSGNQLTSHPSYTATPVPPSIEAMVSTPLTPTPVSTTPFAPTPTKSFSGSTILPTSSDATSAQSMFNMSLGSFGISEKNKAAIQSGKNEVFHVSGNNYTYPEAQSVCRAFGATLATYDQIEEAYNDGADWINYGWSEGQYAYFPLQKETWQGIQDAIKANGGHCPNKMLANVRPGISGGYFANPNIRFGVNCYGIKPPQRSSDNMGGVKIPTIPSLPDPVDQLSQIYQKNLDQLKIDSFDANKWSEYK